MKIRINEIESHSESNHFSARKTDDSYPALGKLPPFLGYGLSQ
jgi:hypothetical protein